MMPVITPLPTETLTEEEFYEIGARCAAPRLHRAWAAVVRGLQVFRRRPRPCECACPCGPLPR